MLIKDFFMAILFLMIIKGFEFILMPQFIKKMALMLIEIPETRIVAYGWLLVIMAFIIWVSYVRYLTY